jgi:hypothetical protein
VLALQCHPETTPIPLSQLDAAGFSRFPWGWAAGDDIHKAIKRITGVRIPILIGNIIRNIVRLRCFWNH